jgi:stearoyl-CoA desaturase (delta-9 desaturase)
MSVTKDTADQQMSGTFVDPKRRKKVFSNDYIHKMQGKHYWLLNIAPIVGTAIAFMSLPYLPFGAIEISLFISLWIITGIGISAGYHRLFTHRSYEAKPLLRKVLHVCGIMAGQGPVVSWAALHRRHHECSDGEGDPHSPNLHDGGAVNNAKGVLHSHLTWMRKHDYPNVVHYVPDLIKDKTVNNIDKYYYSIVLAGALLPALLGGLYHMSIAGALAGFLWGGIARLCWASQTICFINSILHRIGSRRFQTNDNSHNAAILALVTFGESWHNNHHAFPGSASFALEWYRVDPAYWFIKLNEKLGLASHIKLPTKANILNKK